MMNLLKRLVREEEGQGLVEYGLIIALIAIGVTTALISVRGGLNTIFGNIVTELAK